MHCLHSASCTLNSRLLLLSDNRLLLLLGDGQLLLLLEGLSDDSRLSQLELLWSLLLLLRRLCPFDN